MKHSSSLPSPLKITAEVDAALALAGLAGSQVEREAIPLYLSFVFEMIDKSDGDIHLGWKADEIACVIAEWMKVRNMSAAKVVKHLSVQLDEVLGLCKIHGTLSDFKRRELLLFHQCILDYLQQPRTYLLTKPVHAQ